MRRVKAKSAGIDTIAAISTPAGEGGIGIVRLSGPGAVKIADRIFISKDKKEPSRFKTYTVHYGHVVAGPHSKKNTRYEIRDTRYEIVDEVLLTVMRAPKSYTREDIVEINCHSGSQPLKKILDLVLEYGARLAEPGEFTKRAFLNGRLDLAQAESVLDVIRSKTEGSLKVAVDQLEGGLSKRIEAMIDDVMQVAAEIEAAIDFPDEELELSARTELLKRAGKAASGLESLLATFDDGVILREGVLAMICGKPNVGKSSLMNLLLRRDRVIVSPVPGTTRDTVEETINLKGIPVRLVDTAGIGKTKDALAEHGIARSKIYLKLADLVILVLDASGTLNREDTELARLTACKKRLVVINKIDCPRRLDARKAKEYFRKDNIVEISVAKKINIPVLEKAILDMVWSGSFDQAESAILTNRRHKDLLEKARTNLRAATGAIRKGASPELIAVDLKEALFNLGLIIGRSVSDDLLERIFDKFCIGK